jgi:hypothetical protein
MNPQLVNVIVGTVQVAVPALVTYGLGAHWFTPGDLSFVAAILTGLGFTGWSAGTTTAVSK